MIDAYPGGAGLPMLGGEWGCVGASRAGQREALRHSPYLHRCSYTSAPPPCVYGNKRPPAEQGGCGALTLRWR